MSASLKMGAREALAAAAKERILLTDGGWGTQIQLRKLVEADYAGNLGLTHDQKGNNDILALTRPDVVTAIGEAYLDAGSDIVSTNTFSANRDRTSVVRGKCVSVRVALGRHRTSKQTQNQR